MPYGRLAYRVVRTRIVEPTPLWVLRRVGFNQLILTACHPRYSAAQPIVVFARIARRKPPSVRRAR
jgi:sortase A